jgi:hypothetical protein
MRCRDAEGGPVASASDGRPPADLPLLQVLMSEEGLRPHHLWDTAPGGGSSLWSPAV